MVVIRIENDCHEGSPVVAWSRSSPPCSPWRCCAGADRRPRRSAPPAAHRGDVVLPAAVRRPADRRRPRDGDEPDPARPGAARPRAELPQTAQVADADVVVYESGFQAAVDDAVDQSGPAHVVDAAGGRATCPATTRTSGSTRPGCPRSPPPFEKQVAAADPAHAADYARNLAGLQRDLTASTGRSGSGLAHCRRHTDRGQPRRVRLPRPPVRPRRGGHQRALPRRRAVARARPRSSRT